MPQGPRPMLSTRNVISKRRFRAKTRMAEQRRFIQQAELYLIKRQNAHLGVIEM